MMNSVETARLVPSIAEGTHAQPAATSTRATDMTECGERELLERMLARESRAWREFHRRYDRLVHRCIQKVTGRFSGVLSNEDVREIHAMFLFNLTTHDMRRLRRFEFERGNKLGSWLGMLAMNTAWDYLRVVARQPRLGSLAEAEQVAAPFEDPYHALLEKERWGVLNTTLSAFSGKDQQFVRLYYVDGVSPEEIAEEMGISIKTVYSKKHKIRRRLEKVLAPLIEARRAEERAHDEDEITLTFEGATDTDEDESDSRLAA